MALKELNRPLEAVKIYDDLIASSTTPREVSSTLEKERKEVQRVLAELNDVGLPMPPPPPPPPAATEAASKRRIVIEESNSSDEEEDALSPSLPVPSSSLMASSVSPQPPVATTGHSASAATSSSSPPPVAMKTPPSSTNAAAEPPGVATPARGGIHSTAATKAAEAIDKLASKRPPPPRSALEFERSCKLVAGNSDVLVDFVRSVPPDSYPGIFKDALNGSAVSVIAKALSLLAPTDPDFAELSLRRLSEVSRFSMVTSMMGKADKAVVSSVLQALSGAGKDVTDLKSKFRV